MDVYEELTKISAQLKQLIEISPHFASSYNARIVLKDSLKRLQHVIKHYEKTWQRRKHNEGGHFHVAWIGI